MTGRLHSLESFGAADGPGVRFVVFLSGCPFRCAYCHNPDTWARPPAEERTPAEVWARAERYRAYWGAEGGITLSGGEPMLQPEFGVELFRLAHAAGATTCLDTAAACWEVGEGARGGARAELLASSDTVLLDLKAMDEDLHRRLTGASNDGVLDCARHLDSIGARVIIRHVNVPGLTDTPEEIAALERFAASLATQPQIEYLPYHTLGVGKWKALGLDYPLDELLKGTVK